MLRPEPELPDFLYHAVVSEFAEALADLRAPVHGAADWAACRVIPPADGGTR